MDDPVASAGGSGGVNEPADSARIRQRLASAGAAEAPARVQARTMVALPGGASRAWVCQADDGCRYVVKCRDNPHDRLQGCLPSKVLTTEIVCGRLGARFDPPVCPPVAVVELPPRLTAAHFYSATRVHPCPGPSFGSRLWEGAVDLKAARRPLDRVPPESLARLVVFQTWLRGEDPSALISADGREIRSIDHAFFLTGSRWRREILAAPPLVTPSLPARLQAELPRFGLPCVFAPALAELAALREEAIVAAVAGLPAEWGVGLDLQAEVAAFVLARRPLVEAAVATLWPGGAGRRPAG